MRIPFDITCPTLLVDKLKVQEHILRMSEKAASNRSVLRPHFKTHQSGVVGNWFRDFGIDRITVSSVEMANYFFQHGWQDITIAFPVNLRELDAINRMLSLGVKLNLLVESTDVATRLSNALGSEAGIYIKLDTGAGRTGIQIDSEEQILELCQLVASLPNLVLKGLLTHAGHTYRARSLNEIKTIAVEASQRMSALRKASGMMDLVLSWGDTPSCSMLEVLEGFDEWRPGNFVFYDVMQYHIGACSLEDVAVAMACPVVAVHHGRKQLVVHGGAVHFSSEFIAAENGFRLYGYVVLLDEKGWSAPVPGAWLQALSQEHGIVQLPEGMTESFRVGDVLGILPVHSCLTVHAMSRMRSLDGQLIGCFR